MELITSHLADTSCAAELYPSIVNLLKNFWSFSSGSKTMIKKYWANYDLNGPPFFLAFQEISLPPSNISKKTIFIKECYSNHKSRKLPYILKVSNMKELWAPVKTSKFNITDSKILVNFYNDLIHLPTAQMPYIYILLNVQFQTSSFQKTELVFTDCCMRQYKEVCDTF